MERVLDVYKRPFDPLLPWCMDVLIAETRVPIPGLPGRVARHLTGAAVYALASEPLSIAVRITERRTKRDSFP